MGIITIDTFKEKFNVAVDKASGKNINNTIHDVLFSNDKKATQTDVEILKEYKELLDSNIITQEEFNIKKQQILNL